MEVFCIFPLSGISELPFDSSFLSSLGFMWSCFSFYLVLFSFLFLLMPHAPDFVSPGKVSHYMFLEKIGFVLIFKKNIPQHSQVERTCIIGERERESVCVCVCVCV